MQASATKTTGAAQPRGLFLLCFTEAWERFSFYGMRALLVLFLIATPQQHGFGWSFETASRLYGWYTGLVYLTPVLGGWLADRWLGKHRSLLVGGSIIALGHFALAFGTPPFFFTGLALIVVGTGLFKPNISTMAGELYGPSDQRRDAGFTLFYMGINFGAFLGALVCGYLGESARWGWHYGFGAAGVGMIGGLVIYAWQRRRFLRDVGLAPAKSSVATTRVARAPLSPEERRHIAVLVVLAIFVIFFWTAFEQAGSSMSVFARDHIDRSVLGFEVPAAWFQSVNPALILVFGPLVASLWLRLGRRRAEPSAPAKMALGLVLLAAGFVVLVGGAVAARSGAASPLWLVGAYALHTLGELCLSPVGLALVTRLAPATMVSMMMGVWFLANFAANLLAGYLASAMAVIASGRVFHVFGGTADYYAIFVASSLAAAVLLAVITPWLNRMMRAGAPSVPEGPERSRPSVVAPTPAPGRA